MISAWVLFALATRTPILTYHDIILTRNKGSVWFDCTVDEFKSQIEWLKRRGASFVSTEDVYAALTHKKALPKQAVCITFADNYEGFYRYAWPILKREHIPCTQFVHTGFIGAKIGRPKMTKAQLVELDRSKLVTVASQTVSHPADLTKMTDAEVLAEFKKSKSGLEKLLGHPVWQLAYPNGKYDARVASLARAAGYRIAFTEDCLPAESAAGLWTVPRYVHTKYQTAWRAKGKVTKP